MNIILASASPRRKNILDLFNIDYSIEISDSEEVVLNQFSPCVNAMHIAYLKASNIAKNNPKSTVLAADTLVSIESKIFGKAKDSNDAYQMIQALSGKKHEVITGFCIINKEKNIVYVDYVKTYVYFRNLSNDIINKYIETNEYMDKAGAYAIQGKASILVDKIDGDYFNVVGFPISEINSVLSQYFSYDLLKW